MVVSGGGGLCGGVCCGWVGDRGGAISCPGQMVGVVGVSGGCVVDVGGEHGSLLGSQFGDW